MKALIDCNNFYASCERLFRPDLRNRPIIVLSNNDGCIIARSNEAKALGIKMGEPFFLVKDLCKRNQVEVFSSNFALYGDISERVMATIKSAWPFVEVYSIDEAFLDLNILSVTEQTHFCFALQKRIFKEVGIPTSIGIGRSKTLAKLANHICKKELKIPVFNIDTKRDWLKKIIVGDVWGIGRKWQQQLVSQGIYTAYDLAKQNPHNIRRQFSVVMMRIVMELQGVSCLELEEIKPKKGILSSKSFGSMQNQFSSVAEAVSSHVARAHEKLRQQKMLTKNIRVFVKTNKHRQDLAQHYQAMEVKLHTATDDLRLLTHHAKEGLKQIFKEGFFYKKVGVYFSDLSEKNIQQFDMFYNPTETSMANSEKLMKVMDEINQKYGRSTLKLAAEGYSKPWAMRSELKSPCYTTAWKDLPIVKNLT